MSSLPPELAAWAEVLAGFAPDLAEPVGLLARRLDLVIGRVRARPRPLGDDPDGYDGLDRRGPYDRLVLSEWALAEVLPEEFDRRAASGEQAFLRLDRRDRRRGVRTVVLLDAGPEQLGGPRVVQLAALVVLWRRAAAARAELAWGMVQGTAPLQATIDRATVQGFLGGRTGRPATAADVLAARDRAGVADEVWIVGSPPSGDGALGPRPGQPTPLLLALAEAVAPNLRAVDVRLTRGGALVGEARLDLPSPALTRQLLVEPFPAPTAAPRPSVPVAPPVEPSWRAFPRQGRNPSLVRFVPGTEQLVAVLEGGLVFSWGFDNGKVKSPKPKQHAIPEEPLIALGYARQRTIAITRTADGGIRPSWFGAAIPPERVPGPKPALGAGTLVSIGEDVLFVDVAGTAYSLAREAAGSGLRVVSEHVIALFVHHQDVLLVRREQARTQLCRTDGTAYRDLPGTQAWTAWNGGLLMTQDGAELHAWRIPAYLPSGDALQALPAPPAPPPGAIVYGVGIRGRDPVPVYWHDGAFHHPGTGMAVRPPRPPLEPTVSPDGTVVAWRTDEGFLEAWSLQTGAPLVQRHAG